LSAQQPSGFQAGRSLNVAAQALYSWPLQQTASISRPPVLNPACSTALCRSSQTGKFAALRQTACRPAQQYDTAASIPTESAQPLPGPGRYHEKSCALPETCKQLRHGPG